MQLSDFAKTERQKQIADLFESGVPVVEIAKQLGCSHPNISQVLRRIRARAASKGWAPETGLEQPVAEGFRIKGTSTLTKNADGDNVWIKTDRDPVVFEENLALIAEEFKKDLPRYGNPDYAVLDNLEPDLLNLFMVTDYHLGMLAWGEETGGDDWDTQIGEEMLRAWIDEAIKRARWTLTHVSRSW